MQFCGRILLNGEVLVKNVAGEMRLNDAGDGWAGNFAVAVGRGHQGGTGLHTD
jgi:hypothetical protein